MIVPPVPDKPVKGGSAAAALAAYPSIIVARGCVYLDPGLLIERQK
jgi:hypothetical protein